MSLGFLTESALLPSKAKPIKVDSKSVLDLKAIVFRKEQERDARKRQTHRLLENDEETEEVPPSRLRGKKRLRESKEKRNRGVEKRNQQDQAARELHASDSEDDAALQQKSKEMLARKAKLYEEMMMRQRDGTKPNDGELNMAECMVDFAAKRQNDATTRVDEARDDRAEDIVTIVDEFGRTRSVKRGSEAHRAAMNNEKKEQEAEARSKTSATSGFVVSQWDKRFKADEKTYLKQVHQGVEQVKAGLQAKLLRKQQRLERLRQQQLQQSNGKATANEATASNEEAAAAQATAFLHQLTSN